MNPPRRTTPWPLLLGAGLSLALVVLAGGFLLERLWFPAGTGPASAGIERDVRAQLAARMQLLEGAVARLAATPNLASLVAQGTLSAPRLFEALEEVPRAGESVDLSVTIHGADRAALAWLGRPSTLPADRLAGPAALFVAPGPIGLRLVHVAPITAGDGGAARRVGSIAAESLLSPARDVAATPNGDYTLETRAGPVRLRTRFEGAGPEPAHGGFVVRAPTGETLVEVETDPSTLEQARRLWRGRVRSSALLLVALTLLVASAPLAGRRARAATPLSFAGTTLGLLVVFVAARGIAWAALPAWWRTSVALVPSPGDPTVLRLMARSAVDLALTGLLLAGLAALLVTTAQRVRIARHGSRRTPGPGARARAGFAAHQAGAAVLATVVLTGFESLLGSLVQRTGVDVLHLALHPWSAGRLSAIVGLVALQAGAMWTAAGVLLLALSRWRLARPAPASGLLALTAWLVAAVAVLALERRSGWDMPSVPVLVALAVSGAAAWVAARGLGWFRRGSQALRLMTLFLAVLLPALLLYPSLSYYVNRQKARLIEGTFAPQAMEHPRELRARLAESLDQIDREPDLALRVAALDPGQAPLTDVAFLVWRRTALAEHRLTSAVELYEAGGRLVSRFALSFPEYVSRTPRYAARSCTWQVFGEAAPFGAEERRMLHAERALCGPDGRPSGTIVVHVLPDYNVLPFISARGPYFELLRGAGPAEGRAGSDVGLVVYGWGRTAVYSSSGRAWPLEDALFRRIYRSRAPFWTRLERGGIRHAVYFANDRNGIYALDHPIDGAFDHFVHLAELTTLAGLGFLVLVALGALVQRLVWREARAGRRLLREIRTSFYRKLFLAFVAAAVVPVLTLAVLTRTFVAARLRATVEAEAARTVGVAQRVIEESLAIQPSAEGGPASLTDDLMIWVSRVLDQDVNVFVGPQLAATSERDLFASGLLPTRVLAPVYRAIVLQRLPSVVVADRIGDVGFLTAAAPLRAAGPDTILTVPLASRQQDIEREIDELDRGVQLSALVFVLLGAGIGFWMAERIGDPVQRLTRASRRIAGGDLDARVYVRSADELQRLVESFNAMASELQRQRARLERTNRLEAWAEMARQVAHDIKNPLTPIQLSAEHLRRVSQDQGTPLGPVLDSCVDTILQQVRLLRQIAGEFSSFATTPTPRPQPTDLGEVVREVLGAYATGLEGRVRLSVAIPPAVPPVMVDRTLVGRALTNVIENALHAMPGGGELGVRVAAGEGQATIEVRDTGVGMDEDALARVFEPYFSTKAIGTGLGLTIARRNIELHEGTIEVESRKGVGTTVTLRIPLPPAAARA
jgi:signal transduction histidine kinase